MLSFCCGMNMIKPDFVTRYSPPSTAQRAGNCEETSLRGSELLRQQTRYPVGTYFAASLTMYRHLKRTLLSSCRWMSSKFFHCFSRYKQFAGDHYGALRQCVIVFTTVTQLQTPLAEGVSLCTLEPCGHFALPKQLCSPGTFSR